MALVCSGQTSSFHTEMNFLRRLFVAKFCSDLSNSRKLTINFPPLISRCLKISAPRNQFGIVPLKRACSLLYANPLFKKQGISALLQGHHKFASTKKTFPILSILMLYLTIAAVSRCCYSSNYNCLNISFPKRVSNIGNIN